VASGNLAKQPLSALPRTIGTEGRTFTGVADKVVCLAEAGDRLASMDPNDE